MFKTGDLNLYAGNKRVKDALKLMQSRWPAAITYQEAYKFLQEIEQVHGKHYRTFFTEGAKDKRRGAKDNPVLTRNKYPSLGNIGLESHGPSMPVKIAPARFIHTSMFRMDKPTAVIGIHPNAAVANVAASVDRVKKYDEFVSDLNKTLSYLTSIGMTRIIVQGDFNLRPYDKYNGDYNIFHVLSRHNMETRSFGLEAVSWKGVELLKIQELAKIKTGADHVGHIYTWRN